MVSCQSICNKCKNFTVSDTRSCTQDCQNKGGSAATCQKACKYCVAANTSGKSCTSLCSKGAGGQPKYIMYALIALGGVGILALMFYFFRK